jgi:hypothetical protein
MSEPSAQARSKAASVGQEAGSPAALRERGWWAPTRAEHPLGRLQGRPLGEGRLLALLGPKNSVGARYFQLFLRLPDGRLSHAFLLGLHNSGRFPAYNWIDVARYDGAASFAGGDDIALAGAAERRLFRLLGDLIPPGGHLMLEYESAHARSTERMLSLGLPPVATPLGYPMFLAGCGASFRDWYISEGGREGPRRLQGFKPLGAATAAEKAAAMAAELRALLTATPNKERREWETPARRLARRVLRRLDKRTTPGYTPPIRLTAPTGRE